MRCTEKEIFRKVVDLTTYAREEINALGDYYAYGSELINGDTVYDFDTTKLAVNTLDVGLAGIEVYDILRDSTIFRPSSATSAICSPMFRWATVSATSNVW